MNDEKITFVLPKELKRKLEELATKKSISLNALIRMVLAEFLERS